MDNNAPDHFSHSYELQLEHLPTKKSDRIALHILYPGLFFGAILVILGVYEFFNGFRRSRTVFDDLGSSPDTALYPPFITPAFFDAVITIIGLGIIVSLILSYIRYKKIFFDGKTVTIVYRPAFGDKKTYKEPLKNYEGVRFRIEFFQFGFMNKNKYIIELYHKNSHKIAPLYISTSEKDIRRIWERYARALGLPALIMTDEGMVARKVEDLDKSIRDLAAQGLIENKFDDRKPLPPSLALVRKRDKTVIKARKIIWDAYNIMAWIAILLFGILLLAASLTDNMSEGIRHNPWIIGAYVIGVLGIIASIWVLFRKDKIVIKPHKIVIVHKFMLFSKKNTEIYKDDIEAIDVSFNPATERYFVAINSDKNTAIFGKKLPIEELRWVKQFLINEIIKK